MAKRAKMTAGERLAVAAYPLTEFTRNFDVYAKRSSLARRIDAAIKQNGWQVFDAVSFAFEGAYADGAMREAEKILGPRPAKKARRQ